MNSTTTSMIDTRLGPIRVQTTGSGAPVLLWHSLFVDASTWSRLVPRLATERRLVLIDGPNHGLNPRRRASFNLDDCVGVAVDVLDHLGIDEPVDWLGNAWGGHAGILFAADHPQRCRTLVAIGAPVHALTGPERRQIQLLSKVYRLVGPQPVIKPLVDALLGSGARVNDPDGAALVAQAFKRAGRPGMYDAIRWLSLTRPDLTPELRRLEIPTLLITAADDPMWTIAAGRAAAAELPRGALSVLPAAGHIGPLLQAPSALADLIVGFWDDPASVIAAHQPKSTAR